ncbi:MAG: glycosyltransferase family 2 protein [Bacteroidota bacterium]
MKVTGFSFVKNAIIYDYPIVEAIRSILPLCDEVVVAVGQSEDATRELVASIAPEKVRIIDTVWDESLREGGRVLAEETNKALAALAPDTDWAFYIQGDEVIHEKFHPVIRAGMEHCLRNPRVDGLLFKYLHFYGSYDYVGSSSRWYRNEIRVVRPQAGLFSYQDAQGFRKANNQKLDVYPIDAYVYHYGWVKDPRAMQRKQENFNKLWHDDEWVARNVLPAEAFDYAAHINELQRFTDTHPALMRARIDQLNWQFDYDLSLNRKTWKEKGKDFLREYLGWDVGYQNYRIVRV